MPQFNATIKHFKEGVKSMTVSAAVKNIEGWEATLEKIEDSGAKTIVKDLENLKKHLRAKELDGDAIRKLISKLGKETVAISKKTESKNAANIQALGKALTRGRDRRRRSRRLGQPPALNKPLGQGGRTQIRLPAD